jgi:hypothetical protein
MLLLENAHFANLVAHERMHILLLSNLFELGTTWIVICKLKATIVLIAKICSVSPLVANSELTYSLHCSPPYSMEEQ